MRYQLECVCAAIPLILAAAAPAQLSIVSTTREVQARTWGTSLGIPFDGGLMSDASATPGPFSGDVSSTGLSNTTRAYQTSSVGQSLITGSGGIDLDHLTAGGSMTVINLAATMRLEVVFTVSSPVDVIYTASSTQLIGTNTANGFGTTLGLDGQFPFAFTTPPNGPYTASFTGTLAPGTYRLSAFAECSHSSVQPIGARDWNFNLSLAVVPAPSTAALLGLGTVLAARRRTRS